ncbi:hypothetical protein T440DRAFT_553393 [Plenodomus tracheiphilus IPT5]|uniref:LicD/FKTN/FKRP nucleotidyltransferase domain-containing protein n=1 Tax=Plenodomus tracheiphilus IPT5 TaxID=1408161 RepID=A0A6A7BAT0_9PLEO|nr:hypothetical protein T440DRAFT_553393 [Plenodomus tracheiphilus IPT5]
MQLPVEILLLSLAPLAASATIRARSATFDHLLGLTSLTNDQSRKDLVQRPNKYFHEATFDAHYDGRFAGTGLPLETRTWHLRLLLRTYIETMNRIGIKTWIMHGCLLGWFWNGKIMPWDNDVDVMVEESGMRELGNWWNMTVHHFSGLNLGLLDPPPNSQDEKTDQDLSKDQLLALEVTKMKIENLRTEVLETGKKYLLEINPQHINTSTTDKYNLIDARWIDTSTGLYIDITTLHTTPDMPSNPPPSDPNVDDPDDLDQDATPPLEMFTKDNHVYTSTSLFPLRTTTFESIPIKIPYDYSAILAEEYGAKALTRTWYAAPKGKVFEFMRERKEWVEREEGFGGEGRGSQGRSRKGSSAKGRGGGRRKAKTVDDILEGREGELIEDDEDGDGDGEGFVQFGGGW